MTFIIHGLDDVPRIKFYFSSRSGDPIAICEVVVVIPSAQPGNASLAKGSGRSNGEWDPGLPEKSGKILCKHFEQCYEKSTHHMSASPL